MSASHGVVPRRFMTTSSPPVRVLVAGAGAFGKEHLARLAKRSDAKVVGVADTNPAALEPIGAVKRRALAGLRRSAAPNGTIGARSGQLSRAPVFSSNKCADATSGVIGNVSPGLAVMR
jgi:hypothetical protein